MKALKTHNSFSWCLQSKPNKDDGSLTITDKFLSGETVAWFTVYVNKYLENVVKVNKYIPVVDVKMEKGRNNETFCKKRFFLCKKLDSKLAQH